MNNNLNENFLLKIMEHVEDVYISTDKEVFSFYLEKFDFSVEIPYSQTSNHVDVYFIYNTTDENDFFQQKCINFYFESYCNIEKFMQILYQKYEKYINYSSLSPNILDKFDNMLKIPVDENYPYDLKNINDETPFIKEKNGQERYDIDLGNITYSKELKFKPLAPLEIDLQYTLDQKTIKYKKIIPSYLVNQYPILMKYVKGHRIIKDINEFSEVLESLNLSNDKSGKILNSFILDVELETNNPIKNSRLKL